MLTSKYIYHDSKDTHNKHSKGGWFWDTNPSSFKCSRSKSRRQMIIHTIEQMPNNTWFQAKGRNQSCSEYFFFLHEIERAFLFPRNLFNMQILVSRTHLILHIKERNHSIFVAEGNNFTFLISSRSPSSLHLSNRTIPTYAVFHVSKF